MAAAFASALACWAPAHAADDLLAQLSAAASARQSAVLEAVVNGRPSGMVFAVVERGQVIGIDPAALRAWRVELQAPPTFEFEERRYVTVTALTGAKLNVEPRTQRLLVELPPTLFATTEIRYGAERQLTPSPVVPAALLNYTLFGYTSPDTSYGAGFLEAGVSGSAGSLIATASANTAVPAGQTTHRIVRYDTTFRRDDPGGLLTLQLGDSFTQPGGWGRSVRFGGVQYGTNFNLQPNLITYPLQVFAGTAVVPSTVDVFVNGSRIASQAVDPGPFSINDVPLVSGAGDVQLVVRDAFGQQQVLSQPFYASRRLLRAGLDEFLVSAGAIRRNYGLDSFDYNGGMAAGQWRRGLTDHLTIETRAEGDQDVRSGGLTVDAIVGRLGTVTAGVAASGGRAGNGQLWLAGYEYFGRGFSFSARSFWASPDFRTVGDDGLPPLQRQSYVSAGTNFGAAGSVGIAWAAQRYRRLPAIDTVALTYTATLAPRAFLTLSVSRTLSVVDQTSAFATVTFALEPRTSAGGEISTTRSGPHDTSYAAWSVQRSLPTDQGVGFRLRATTQDQVDAGVGYTWPYGTYSLEASTFRDVSAARATASGGLGWVGGRAFASRNVSESFGVVQVGDLEGVRVFHDGNPVGRTDAEGRIVLHRMTPYVANRISIDERDLPLDVSIRHRELRVVPQYRSGVLASYDAQRRISVIVEVLGSDGRHLPAGTEVALADSPLRLLVADRGEMYVPDLPADARFIVDEPRGRCRFEVRLSNPPKELMPKVGPYRCETF